MVAQKKGGKKSCCIGSLTSSREENVGKVDFCFIFNRIEAGGNNNKAGKRWQQGWDSDCNNEREINNRNSDSEILFSDDDDKWEQ